LLLFLILWKLASFFHSCANIVKRTASTCVLSTMCFQFQSKLSYSNQRLWDETEYDIKNYTDRGKAATLRQILVIKYLNRVETVEDWPTFQISLRPNVYTLLRAFPEVWTGRQDNDIGFFKEFLMKNHLLRAYHLRFDWSSCIVLINSEILIVTGMVWPVHSDKWKPPFLDCLFPRWYIC